MRSVTSIQSSKNFIEERKQQKELMKKTLLELSGKINVLLQRKEFEIFCEALKAKRNIHIQQLIYAKNGSVEVHENQEAIKLIDELLHYPEILARKVAEL